jgi:hypothetical protein
LLLAEIAARFGVRGGDHWGKKAYLTSVSIYTQMGKNEERDRTFLPAFFKGVLF